MLSNGSIVNCSGPVDICCGITYGISSVKVNPSKLGEIKSNIFKPALPRLNCLKIGSFGSDILEIYASDLS